MIEKMYAAWVYVNDLQVSRKFYEEMLGLRYKFQDGGWIEFDLGETSFALLQRAKEKGPVEPQKTRIMFEVDDIEKLRRALLSKGVKIIGGLRKESYGILLTFEDSNGHWLELFEPLERS